MNKRSRLTTGLLFGLVVGFTLASCAQDTAPAMPSRRVAEAVAQVFGDPAVQAFFTAEAARANVGELILVRGNGPYGSTSFDTGSRRSVIRIYVDRPGARTPTNLAHEIAHAAVYRQGCYNHGARWLAYHLQIAERFEARFPGVLWSGNRPTQNVAGKAARYSNDRC